MIQHAVSASAADWHTHMISRSKRVGRTRSNSGGSTTLRSTAAANAHPVCWTALPIGNHQDVEAGEKETGEVEDRFLHRKADELRVRRRKQEEKPPRSKENQSITDHPHPQKHLSGEPAHG